MNTDEIVSDPTGRVLRLLSLLQRHRRWTSTELADELGITARTVRRDIDRLRRLGYPVEAAPGVDGGYRLAAGTHLPPMMFDDDEAVAIAVGLWSATEAPLDGIEETALRALAKLQMLLPDRLRRRTAAIEATVSIFRWSDERRGETTDVDTLVTVTATCRDAEELRFEYADRTGATSDRLVQPHRLVSIDQRWYLLAWDVRRNDWRTFRVDRMARVRGAGGRFDRRPVPGGDPAAFVADNLGKAPAPFAVTVTLSAGRASVEEVVPWLADRIDELGPDRCAATIEARRPDQLAVTVARLAGAFEVELPESVDPELRDRLAVTAERLGRLVPPAPSGDQV